MFMKHPYVIYKVKKNKDRRGGVEVERSPCMRKTGVRSPVATDLSLKNR